MQSTVQPIGDHRVWLMEELDERVRKNPSYSLRAFAKFLGVSAASLSQVLSGKRRLSRKAATQILKKFDLTPEQAQQFMASALGVGTTASTIEPKQEEIKELCIDTFRLISDWIYDGIRGLGDIRPNSADPVWIGDKLSISPQQAREAFQRLLKLGLVRRRGSGFEKCPMHLQVRTDRHCSALRRYHAKNLRKAEEAMETGEAPLELFSTATIVVDESRLAEARALIKNFRRSLGRLLESGKKERVYNLSIQLFPLSK